MTGALRLPQIHSQHGWIAGFLLLFSGCSGDTDTGLIVEAVAPWGTAWAAGIEDGDVIESWRTSSGHTVATDALELLWVEHHIAPAEPVTLVVRRGRQRLERILDDARWEMKTRPRLETAAWVAYRRAEADGGDFADWQELEQCLDGGSPSTLTWAAFHQGLAAMSSIDRIEEASRAFQRARDLAQRPEIASLLHALEGEALWQSTHYDRSAAPLIEADRALRRLDATSPLLALNLIRLSRRTIRERRLEAARQHLVDAEEILSAYPDAKALHMLALARRGTVEAAAGDHRSAVDAYRSTLASLTREDPLRAGFGLNLGRALVKLGEFEKATHEYRDILEVSGETPRERIQAAGANNSLGLLSKSLGNYDRAERYYLQALELFPRGGAAEAGIRNNLGNLALLRGDLSLATVHHRTALELRQSLQPRSHAVASSYHNLGRVLAEAGRNAEAAKVFDHALTLKAELVPNSQLMASTLLESGLNLLALGEQESAAEYVHEACEIHRTLAPASIELGRCTLALGDVSFRAGDRDQAMSRWRQGLEIIEKLRTRIPSEQGRARFAALFDSHYRKLAAGYLEDGQTVSAFQTLESARARMLRALLQQFGDQAALATSPELLEARRRTESSIEAALARLARLHPIRDSEPIRQLRQELQGLESEREEIYENLYRSVRGLERIERVPEVSLARISRSLPSGSVGLLYALGEERSHAFVVHSAAGDATPGLEVVELPVRRDDMTSRIGVFRSLLERGGKTTELEPALIEQGNALFEDLLAPVAEHVEAASRLFISPDSSLTGLPFAALVRSKVPLAFVAEWKPHAVVASLSSLVELSEDRARRPPPKLEWVAVGAPDLSRRGAAEKARRLGDLPGSAREIETLEALFGNNGTLTLTHRAATEAAVREAIPSGRYVHFATHALLDRRFPLSSSLVLSSGASEGERNERDDGLLHGWEILELPPLAAELVTLAGCETGRGAEWAGEGLIGLTQAFHYRGTPAILASQWRVGDAWVGDVTEAFYRELLAGLPPMEALAQAQSRMIASTSKPDGSWQGHPFYWAAFTLFGVSE